MRKINFEYCGKSGICSIPFPHGKSSYVYSSSCYDCKHFVGKIKDKNSIYCNADEFYKNKTNHKILLLEFKVIKND